MIDPPNSEEAIFQAALELAPEQRASYLASVCAADEALRRRIETLLEAGAEADPFFRQGPLHAVIGGDLSTSTSAILPIEEKPG